MVSKNHIEIIWFISQTSYYWVAIPLANEVTTVKALLEILPWSVDLDEYVTFGDRIELYKPLQLTPNEIRLRRKNQTD